MPHSTIGVIGDSWADYKKLDHTIIDTFKHNNININVSSYGLTGGTSKLIYKTLITENSKSNAMLHDSEIKYIVVVAGVNDSYGHRGKGFYTHHMLNIIKTINKHSKHPVIIEIPEYNIAFKPIRFRSVVKQFLYKHLFDCGKTYVINSYRDSLKSALSKQNLLYTLLPFCIVNNYNESKSLYKDSWHLNTEGNSLLAKYIAESIIKMENVIK